MCSWIKTIFSTRYSKLTYMSSRYKDVVYIIGYWTLRKLQYQTSAKTVSVDSSKEREYWCKQENKKSSSPISSLFILMQWIQVFRSGGSTTEQHTHTRTPTHLNPLHIIQHILPGHQPPCPHQRTRCLKFSPSLSPIQINSRRNAEEVYCVGVECPLIENPTKQCVCVG